MTDYWRQVFIDRRCMGVIFGPDDTKRLYSGKYMDKRSREWLKQADFDIETAEFMFAGGKFFYTVFMCHLSVEKALKGLYQQRLKETPPKTHNLVYLLKKINIRPTEESGKFIIKLNEASVVTRYPEDIDKLQVQYTQDVVKDMLVKSKEILQWIKGQF
jgi:HEPN domain-containing protein